MGINGVIDVYVPYGELDDYIDIYPIPIGIIGKVKGVIGGKGMGGMTIGAIGAKGNIGAIGGM